MPSAPFDWSEYFTLADALGKRPDEASLRSAISRAYYFVYHLGLARAMANGYQRAPGEPSHIQLWRLFSDNPEGICQKLAQIANRLKQKRERADYDTTFPRIDEEVPIMLAEARHFAKLLATLPTRHPSPKSQRQWN